MDTSPLEKVPWWGEINLGKSGCGGNEQKNCEKRWKWVKLGENQKNAISPMWKKYQNLLSNNNGQFVALRAHCVQLPRNSPKIACHQSASTANTQSPQDNNQHMRGHMGRRFSLLAHPSTHRSYPGDPSSWDFGLDP